MNDIAEPGAMPMKHVKVTLSPEVQCLIRETLRIELELQTLPEHADGWRRARQDQHYYHQELGQHVVWAYQEQHET